MDRVRVKCCTAQGVDCVLLGVKVQSVGVNLVNDKIEMMIMVDASYNSIDEVEFARYLRS